MCANASGGASHPSETPEVPDASRSPLSSPSCSSTATSADALPKGAIVDLSHPYDAETIFWPTESGFVLEPEHDGLTDKGYYYRSNKFSAPEHGGTHIDAPAHFAKDGNFVDAIPLEQLVGPAVVVDVSRKCQADRDYRIAIDDFRDWEKAHHEIPDARDRAAAHGVRQILAGPQELSRHGRAWTRGGPEAAFPRARPGGGRLARARAQGQGGRPRHGEHRLRTVDALRDARRAR